jgi:threonine/homoserine/homoserine lactone efflux protein
MPFETIVTCIIAVTLLTLTPGLDTMLVIRNSSRGGWRDGAASSLGICTGLFVHATVSALGISLLLLQTSWAFSAVKFSGAAYLIWLGLCNWKSSVSKTHGNYCLEEARPRNHFSFSRSFREGFLSNVLNPKTVVFYMAFLPQFIAPGRPPLLQSLIVAALHFIIAMTYQCVLAAMVTRAQTILQSSGIKRLFDMLTGSVFVYIGSRLALEE